MRKVLLSLSSVGLALGASRECKQAALQVTSLPYCNQSIPFPCMCAWPFDVKAQPSQNNHHLFNLFFKNVTLADTAPLVLWMNGGLGSTSMFGL